MALEGWLLRNDPEVDFFTHMCIHMHSHEHTQTRMYTLRDTQAHFLRHMQAHAQTQFCTHTHTHSLRHTHTHAHTLILKRLLLKTGKCICVDLGVKGLAVEKAEALTCVCF